MHASGYLHNVRSRRRRSSYTVHTRLRATNGCLSKGCNRLTSGTAMNPCFKKAQERTLSVPLTLRIFQLWTKSEREGRESDAGRTAAISRKRCGKGGNTQSAGWKAMLASLLNGTSSCTNATHTCRQGAVVQYKKQSRHTHEHEQGNLVPHHTQAAATHNHHWPSQERLVSKQPITS
jgi:hypothetical protein